jgi:hypothetical protein
MILCEVRLRRGHMFAGALAGWACALFGVLGGASQTEDRALTPYHVPAFAAAPDARPLTVSSNSLGTFLGVEDEMLLERMRAQTLTKAKLNHGGSSVSFRLEFADGSRAAFKPEQIHPQSVPRKEVAAYRIARLLGLRSVPPATMRRFTKDELLKSLGDESEVQKKRVEAEAIFDEQGSTRGEMSFWIPDIAESFLDDAAYQKLWFDWMKVGNAIPKEREHIMSQLSTLLLFDLLTNNADRFSGGNLKMSPDGQMLYYMDNTFGFQVEPRGHIKCRQAIGKIQKFSRSFVSALRSLSGEQLATAVSHEENILSPAEIEAVMARRSLALSYVDELAQKYGEKNVLVFP